MYPQDLDWFTLGSLIGGALASLAGIVGIVGYLSDVLRARRRRIILAEAREMVGLIRGEAARRDKAKSESQT